MNKMGDLSTPSQFHIDMVRLYQVTRESYMQFPLGESITTHNGELHKIWFRRWGIIVKIQDAYFECEHADLTIRNKNDPNHPQIIYMSPHEPLSLSFNDYIVIKGHIDRLAQIYQVLLCNIIIPPRRLPEST